jgi:GcrA cell cycle regulator
MSPSPASQSYSWSEDRVITLSRLWRDGLSASQIAKQLGGVTRNAVIGKVHRLGLSGRALPSAPRAAKAAIPRPRRAQPPIAARQRPSGKPAPIPATPTPEGPGLVDNLVYLNAHACKWPIGDPKSPSFSFCGRHADGRYCRAHEAQGVRPGTAWRAERDPVLKLAMTGLI